MKTWRIGRLLGFPIEISLSFLVLLGIVFLTMGGLAGVLSVLFAFASVLVHELGHAVTARRLGVPIAGIELNFFGGAAKMAAQPRSARDEILIAAAGPAVSMVLAAVGLGLGALTGWQIVTLLGAVNLVIGVFNLVPALPMDGGRILRAALAGKLGFVRATEWSVRVSRAFAVLFVVAGVWTGNFQLALLAALLWVMGTQELRMAQVIGGYGRRPSFAGASAWAGADSARVPAEGDVDLFAPGARVPFADRPVPLAGSFASPGWYYQSHAAPVRVLLVRGPDGRVRITFA